MALPSQPFESIKVYKDTHELVKLIQQVVARMNRAYKYTTGVKMADTGVSLATCIGMAYTRIIPADKASYIVKCLEYANALLIQLRIVYDLQLISHEIYRDCVVKCVSIITQLRAWDNGQVKYSQSH